VADAACSGCGYNQQRPVGSKRGWALWQCERCGTVCVWPQPTPEQLASIYSCSAGYFATASKDLALTSSSSAWLVDAELRAVGISPGRFLDVGCSTGQLIYHLRALGWSVEGIDVNREAVRTAQENGLDASLCELEDYIGHDGAFDVVYMGDVIEHVRVPLRTLRSAHKLLRGGGVLVARTPNAACSFAKATLVLAKQVHFPWPHSEAPYHLHEFTPMGLGELCDRAGFEVLSVRLTGKTPFLYTLGSTGLFDELKTTMKHSGRYRLNSHLLFSLPKLVGTAALLAPFYVYSRFADRVRATGHAIRLIARRRDYR